MTGGGPDDNGNRKKQEVFIPNVEGAAYDQDWSSHAQVYSYDRLNRLTSAAESGAGTSNAPAPQFSVDAATNRLGVPAGQAGTMSYDASGNLVYDDYTGRGSRAYDAENRMTSAADKDGGTTAYAYDGDGRRVRRNVGTAAEVWQVYGVGGELLAEYAEDASPNQPRKEYGYRGGELLVTCEAAAAGWGPPPTFTGPDPLAKNDPIMLEHLTDQRFRTEPRHMSGRSKTALPTGAPTSSGLSPCTSKGRMRAATPRMQSMFRMFDPMTLPKATSASPRASSHLPAWEVGRPRACQRSAPA